MLKKKNHNTTSINTKKPFDKIQHPFMIQTLRKLGTEGNFLNLIKSKNKNLIGNIFNAAKLNVFPPKIRNKARM